MVNEMCAGKDMLRSMTAAKQCTQVTKGRKQNDVKEHHFPKQATQSHTQCFRNQCENFLPYRQPLLK